MVTSINTNMKKDEINSGSCNDGYIKTRSLLKEEILTEVRKMLNDAYEIELPIKILNYDADIPCYAHYGDSGFDVKCLEEFDLQPNETKLIKLGIACKLPDGYELQVRSRSGHALKFEIFVLNSPGTIDSPYVGEWGVILKNTSNRKISFCKRAKIAQIVCQKVVKCKFKMVDELPETSRGTGGFGSTGK